MKIASRSEPFILLAGDIFILLSSLWLMLFVRYRKIPFESIWLEHFGPFATLMIIWLIVFFICGLYEKHTKLLSKKLPEILSDAQITNTIIGFIYFYLWPDIGIAPKVNLIIYVFITTSLLFIWRRNAHYLFGGRKKEPALLVGRGDSAKQVFEEVNKNSKYRLQFVSWINSDEYDKKTLYQKVINEVFEKKAQVVVLDMNDHTTPVAFDRLSNLMFSNVVFFDLAQVYEEVFDRIPSELVGHRWFLENISKPPLRVFTSFKRIFDIIIGGVGLIITAFLFPFIAIIIKLTSQGPVLCWMERVGERNKHITIPKFRTMQRCDSSKDTLNTTNTVTPIGGVLRSLRIDELPQFWSIVKGDLSFIGPRPEVPIIAQQYEKEIPHYASRSLVRPGLTGWAQLYGEHAHHTIGVKETVNKLSYDLYYLKNRSIILDFKIALKTFKTIISRTGR